MSTQIPLLYTGRRAPVRREFLTDVIELRRGSFAATEDWQSAPSWERHLARIEVFRRRHPYAILSHTSAALAVGLPTFRDPGKVHIFDPHRRATHSTGNTVWHGSVDDRLVVDTPLGPATSPLETAIDIARTENPGFALAVWDAAIRSGVKLREIMAVASRQKSRRGTVTISWLREFADPLSESAGESLSRAVLTWFGYPRPQLQVPIQTPDGLFRGDLFWPESRTVGEFDGYGKYELGTGAPRDSLREEKRREDAIRRAGFTVVRWEYRDIAQPDRLDRILRSAGLRPTQPRALPYLHAFERAMRGS